MALLDRIGKMKQTGMSDSQVADTLMQEGISPREVNDALGQSKIKSAIYPNEQAQGEEQAMQPSIMEQSEGGTAAPLPSQGYQNQNYYPGQDNTQGFYQDPTQAYAQDGYDQTQQGYDQVYYQQAIDMETVRDITRQEIEDSLKKIKQDMDALSKIKTEMKFQVQGIDSRLARIENIIQELQSAIIRKMGEYGEAISSVSEELQATQNSFSKMINPLMDKKRGYQEDLKNQAQESQEQYEEPAPTTNPPEKQFKKKPQAQQSKNRKADSRVSVEDYFR
ncbi:hypothetical protein FJZ17_00170 [Candidatus Pacearchaeota archaeon]|nr:hypothetical protein [Candidatus Pacearchaeota archaeon]